MEKDKVFVTRCRDSFPPEAMARLEAACDVSYWRDEAAIPAPELAAAVRDKAGLLCLLTDRVDSAVLEAAPALRVVATLSAGHDHLDLASLRARNILVASTPGVLTAATAELTVALLLATSRRLLEGSAALRAGEWRGWSPLWLCGPQLTGATVGIVGLGNIGQAVMARLQPFGVRRFLYWGRARKEAAAERGAEFVPFSTLLRESDFVVVTCAYSPELRHKFDAAAFQQMKRSAVLVNTSRGAVLDQAALEAALRTGQISAAGLDVMTPEPLPPDHPLTRLGNCVLVPHLGSATTQTRAAMADLAVDNILAALAGNTEAMPSRLELD